MHEWNSITVSHKHTNYSSVMVRVADCYTITITIRLIWRELWKTRMSRWTVKCLWWPRSMMLTKTIRHWVWFPIQPLNFLSIGTNYYHMMITSRYSPVLCISALHFSTCVHYVFCMSSLHFRVKHIPSPPPLELHFWVKYIILFWDKTDSVLLPPSPISRNFLLG